MFLIYTFSIIIKIHDFEQLVGSDKIAQIIRLSSRWKSQIDSMKGRPESSTSYPFS